MRKKNKLLPKASVKLSCKQCKIFHFLAENCSLPKQRYLPVVFMKVKEVVFVIFWLLKSTAGANETCSAQCNLLVDGNDMSAEFQSKSSEYGVRMVYLHLNVGNNSHSPLQSPEKFLPNRWTWARGVEEPMLYFSYQYQILSLGLLKNQVRNMEITLSDEPRGCVANLTSSCKDIVVATTLLGKVTDASTDLSLSEGVVCVSVVKRDINWLSSWFEGNIQYHCCKQEQSGNETVVQCDLPVKYSKWFMLFYHLLTLGTIVLFFYWPLVVPWPQEPVRYDVGIKTNEIPVDDFSPITCQALYNLFDFDLWPEGNIIPNALQKSHTVETMIEFYYIRVLIYAYIFVALNYAFFLDYLTEVDAKNAFPENALFYYVFDMRSSKLNCLIPVIIFFIILPVNFFFFMAYASKKIEPNIYRKMTDNLSVFQNREVNCFHEVPSVSPSTSQLQGGGSESCEICGVPFAPSNCIVRYLQKKSGESRKMLFVILFLFLSTTFGLVLIVLKAFLFILSYSIPILVLPFKVLPALVINAIRFSPFSTLVIIICKFIHKNLTKKLSLYVCMLVFLIWLIYFSLAVTVCCRFFIRMFGFVLVGLIINAEKAAPYAAFVLIFLSNIYTSYNTLRKKFKGMKKIIYKHYKKKITRLPNVDIIRKTLPEKLFWDVCRDVLPIQPEMFAMLANMLLIFSVSLLAVAVIVFFSQVFNSSTLTLAGALLLSAKLAEILFNGMFKGEKFTGWDKIEKSEKVEECIDKYIKQCESENVDIVIED